jgi:hypothetical protein
LTLEVSDRLIHIMSILESLIPSRWGGFSKMANIEQVAVFRDNDGQEWNKWRVAHSALRPNLSGAHLIGEPNWRRYRYQYTARKNEDGQCFRADCARTRSSLSRLSEEGSHFFFHSATFSGLPHA